MHKEGQPSRCMRNAMVLGLLLVPALAGCLTSEGADGLTGSVRGAMNAIGEPIELAHDHNDHRLHTGSHNVDFLSWSNLGITLGDNGFANFVLWQDGNERLAFVAIDGDNDGGFVIVDVNDPAAPEVLGSYMVPGNSFQEVRVTPDGRYAVLNIQDLPASVGVPPVDSEEVQGRLSHEGDYCPVCIHVVDVTDRSSPELSSLTPVELLGTHNMDFQEQDGQLYLYYVGQPLSYTPGNGASTAGNHVYIARFEEEGGRAGLVPVGDFRHDTSNDQGDRSFPHDVIVSTHPGTGQDIAYVSHWDGGAITFDVTDPMNPVELGVEASYSPSDALAIHWFDQEPEARDNGRVYAWSAPEIGSLGTGTGVIRGYDITDPGDFHQVGSWELPGDDLVIENRFILSPHTAIVDPETQILAVAHYHAGIWLLDVSDPADPRHVGYYLPHGDHDEPWQGPVWWKKPNFSPDGYGPNAYMARWDDRGDETILWVTDRGTGLYALRYDGPINGR